MNTRAVLQILSPEEMAVSPLRDIYESSFPTDERRLFDSVVEIARTDPDFNFYAVVHGDEIIGLFSTWKLDDFLFIEHFAIAEKYRGWGIGKKILEKWIAGQNLPVVLEAERPQDEMALRRIAFYQRIGFRYWPVNYLQPAYSINQHPVPMHLLTYGDINLDEALTEVRQRLYRKVYANALI